MDSGEERIDNAEILAQVRQQAAKVRLQSTISALVLTVVSLIIPA